MSAGKVLLGLMAGFAAGAVIGILFAPGKGSSTRKKISHRSDEFLSELGDKFEEFINGITKKFESVKEDAIRMTERGKAKVEDMEEKVNRS